MFEGEDVVGNIKAQQLAAEKHRREGLVRRLTGFLEQDAAGDANHPAEAAKAALQAGNIAEVITYLSREIDQAEAKGDENRRGELMRWKVSLGSNDN